MTDYHPVTKEELEQIRADCFHPEFKHINEYTCDKCKYESIRGVRCSAKITELKDEVLTRPDPLEVLEKWRATQINSYEGLWKMETSFIKELRDNPDAVIARGKKEGWL